MLKEKKIKRQICKENILNYNKNWKMTENQKDKIEKKK